MNKLDVKNIAGVAYIQTKIRDLSPPFQPNPLFEKCLIDGFLGIDTITALNHIAKVAYGATSYQPAISSSPGEGIYSLQCWYGYISGYIQVKNPFGIMNTDGEWGNQVKMCFDKVFEDYKAKMESPVLKGQYYIDIIDHKLVNDWPELGCEELLAQAMRWENPVVSVEQFLAPRTFGLKLLVLHQTKEIIGLIAYGLPNTLTGLSSYVIGGIKVKDIGSDIGMNPLITSVIAEAVSRGKEVIAYDDPSDKYWHDICENVLSEYNISIK